MKNQALSIKVFLVEVKVDGPTDWKWTVQRLELDGPRKLVTKSGRSKAHIWRLNRESGRSKSRLLTDKEYVLSHQLMLK